MKLSVIVALVAVSSSAFAGSNINQNANTNINVNQNGNLNANLNANKSVAANTGKTVSPPKVTPPKTGGTKAPVKSPVVKTSNTTNTANSNSSSNSSNTSSQYQNAVTTSGSDSASESGAASNSSADNQGNDQHTTYNSSTNIPRQTPMAISGDVQPTASCRNARNGGASSPVAGLSFGFSTKDDECDLRETARLFFEMGRPDLGINLLCASKAAKHLAVCEALVPVPTYVYPPGERERRIQEHGGPHFSK